MSDSIEATTHEMIVEIIQECCILMDRWSKEKGHAFDMEGYAASLYLKSHSDGFSVVLARQDDKTVGMAEIDLFEDAWTGDVKAYVDHAYVLPEYRDQGVFALIIDMLEAKAEQAGAKAMTHMAPLDNDRLIDYYKGRGWEPTHYYMSKEMKKCPQ